ncbi:MAG: NAD(P)(+) transhydrogenase (Re/Si-specific) subunit beta [Deltaproteobacteria bacterium]|nr:NAD(P)(+) transhydrogenase (Re/Si-specific) subunit beta [Deltaproteobacteria bacterium]
MPASLSTVTYVVAAMLFVASLRGLSNQESARRGNLLGTIGMLIAVVVTLALIAVPSAGVASVSMTKLGVLGGAIAVGGLIGSVLAARVAMTSMPELVAILHSFVGLAAVLVGIGTAMEGRAHDTAHAIETYLGVVVGAITFTGSIIAFLKLRATIGSRPLVIPGRHVINATMLIACIVLGVMAGGRKEAMPELLGLTVIAGVLGAHLVLAIGGGDMPVVVSLLNSYSGWAASAAGFMLGNDLLIITGALVGSSGAILSYFMCRAMNRSIWNVVFAGFGDVPKAAKGGKQEEQKPVIQTNVDETAELLLNAKSVIVVPGYGMAVAQAQHAVKQITTMLQDHGVQCRYAIHPVAGRLPGHMNVLLAEADVPYDIVQEMDEINADMDKTDVVIVIGANDIVNPSALEDESSPIWGMPVLEVWKAAKVVMLKRSMAAGYAGVENPLCFRENTLMLFGDAKQTVTKLLTSIAAKNAEAA